MRLKATPLDVIRQIPTIIDKTDGTRHIIKVQTINSSTFNYFNDGEGIVSRE